jgi:hypothetical protein
MENAQGFDPQFPTYLHIFPLFATKQHYRHSKAIAQALFFGFVWRNAAKMPLKVGIW